ncbi:hypothetical protein DOS68_09315 [Staphylococcus felis]|uniref:Uncharacterized protein n=1 Tax=Staphylococcus felis TaxID=46127 RepID=A0AAX1RT07_9STAP|nr:hypothetical protein [Staphylococcus felis]REH81049.1 hypothetical protein DOS59_00430 [Staphylococcus felis]REH84943.1 hypothetical protein DOS63_05890 [Staphylococcus felis]REH86318.1 hypothetical protein DOS56_00380 [Staphylococcus felis]REH89065.1 hypothetical protein DOS68_09315 [Staphylococcus felis]REH98477.1 hypothetical protein DOS64_11420 [Staphylococcus felis]
MKTKDYIILIISILPLVSMIMQLMNISLVSQNQSFFSIINVICIIVTLVYAGVLIFKYKEKNSIQKAIIILSGIYLLIILIIMIGIIINML